MLKVINTISVSAIPVTIFLIVTIGAIKGVKIYEVFVSGAKEGIKTAVRVLPHLIAMLVAVNIFISSGAMKYLCYIFTPFTKVIGMPAEVFPMALLRPLSGGGAMGVMNTLFVKYGPDSFIGKMCSIMAGSTDTTFYILAVYFGSVNIKNVRHSMLSGLCADAAGILAACLITNLLY